MEKDNLELKIEENFGTKGDRVFMSLKNDEGGSIGFVYLKLYFPNYKELSHYKVNFIFVKDSYRGKGYGSFLLENVKEFLDNKKIVGILSDQRKKDLVNNLNNDFYGRHGWILYENEYYYPKILDE